MDYLNFGEKTVDITNNVEVCEAYNQGFVFTRVKLGHMEKVRSVRIDLSKFTLSSENRRILRKFEHTFKINNIPFEKYSWQIHKLGKDFYDAKFGKDIFSANKIQELFTSENTNFNKIISFEFNSMTEGYCIAYEGTTKSEKILHYAYPFYNLELINSSFGMFMMTKTIDELKSLEFKYIYLGSAHSKSSLYKLQFAGVEWFDENTNSWDQQIDSLKAKFEK